jgi:hypothetical protein
VGGLRGDAGREHPAGGSLVGNPGLSASGAAPKEIPPPQGVFAITRHPMNWSFMLWAATHIALIGRHGT